MIRSFAFTTQGRLHTQDIDLFLMPTLLADTNLFLWVDFENPTPEEVQSILAGVFHFHPLSIEDCTAVNSSPKVEEYTPKDGDLFTPYLFMVIHAVDYKRADGKFATSELDFFLGKNFLVTYHQQPLRPISVIEERCMKGAMQIARAPDRVAHSLLDMLVDGYKPALDELALEISAVEEKVLQHPDRQTFNHILQPCGKSSAPNAKCWRGSAPGNSSSSVRNSSRISATFMIRCAASTKWRSPTPIRSPAFCRFTSTCRPTRPAKS